MQRVSITKVWEFAQMLWSNPDSTAERSSIIVEDYPGFAKTKGFLTVGAKHFGAENVHLRYFQSLEPADFMGIPAIVNNVAKFIPMEFARSVTEATEPTLFILDDLGQASQEIQFQLMQVLGSREIGGRKIPDNVYFVGTTNPVGNSGVYNLNEAMVDRGYYFQTYLPSLAWFDWAVGAKIHSGILAVVQRFPEKFFPGPSGFNRSQFKGDGFLDKKTPSARGMERLSDALAIISPDDHQMITQVACASLGTKAGTEMATYLEIMSELPRLSDIKANPRVVSGLSPDIQFMISTFLAMKCSTAEDSLFMLPAISALKPEARQVAINTLIARSRTEEGRTLFSNFNQQVFIDFNNKHHQELMYVS